MSRSTSLCEFLQPIRKATFFGKNACLLACLLPFLVIGTNPVTAESNLHVPKPGTHPLSIDELRWCRTEVYRLAGEAKEVVPNDYWDIYDYNENVQRYRSVCLDRTYSPDAARRISSELTPAAKQGMRDAGTRRFAFSRVQRNKNRIYVASTETRAFDASNLDSAAVANLRQWDEAFLLGKNEANRVEIEWVAGIPPARMTGWIDQSSFSPGNGGEAREAYCRANRGAPVGPNELLHGSLTRERFMLLQVRNPTPQDAYVKLLRPGQGVVVAFVVKAGFTRTINGLPQGEFEVAYATGIEFSRGCRSFVKRGFTGRVSQPIIYDDHSYEWEISLRTPSMSLSSRDTNAYAEFEAL